MSLRSSESGGFLHGYKARNIARSAPSFQFHWEEISELLEGLHHDGYRWEHGPAKGSDGKEFGLYLLGRPVEE